MINVIVVLIILIILGAAITYIVRAKKKGAKWIFCPAADSCCSAKKETEQSCGCGCHGEK